MRAADRNPRTKNHNVFTPAQRRLAALVGALRRAQNSWDAPPVARVEELASAVAGAEWGPFGAFFITVNEPYWAGVDHRYKTVWVNRRPVLTVQMRWDGTHTVEKVFSLQDGEAYFQQVHTSRREHAARAAEVAARVRRIIGRATPAQRVAMRLAAVNGSQVVLRRDAAGEPTMWFHGGTIEIIENGVYEYLAAHNAVLSCIQQDEAERHEREAARTRAAGIARIGRGISEAAWTAVCLAREAEAMEAVSRLRRIHA